jgi:hypothetical protein
VCGAITSDEELLGTFLPNGMTRADAATIVKKHKAKRHVNGLGFSLDFCHFKWKNCPTAWKGQFQDATGNPSIVLEAGTDHDLFFWHCQHMKANLILHMPHCAGMHMKAKGADVLS